MNRWIASGPHRWFLIALVVLLPACIASVVTDPLFQQLPKPTSDGPVYENMAFHLSRGQGFYIDWSAPQWRSLYEQSPQSAEYAAYLNAPPQSMPMTGRPPLLPLILAAIYKVVGRNEIAFATLRIILAICLATAGALSVANAQTLFDRLFPGADKSNRRWPMIVGCIGAIALAASNRTLLSYASDFLTEPVALVSTQLLVTLLLFAQGPRHCDKSDELESQSRFQAAPVALAMCATIAAMIYVRSLFVLWLPGLWGLLFVVWPGSKIQKFRWATLVLVGALVLLSPWWIRNCIILSRFMPLGTQGPITLLGGYCDEALANGGDWQHAPELRLREALRQDPGFIALPNDIQRELRVVDESKVLVRAWINEHWLDFPQLFIQRIVTHWNPYFGRSLVWKILALCGAIAILIYQRKEGWVLVGLPVMNTILVAMLYTTGGRFLVPLYGVLFTLAGIGIAILVRAAIGLVIPKANGGRGSTPGL